MVPFRLGTFNIVTIVQDLVLSDSWRRCPDLRRAGLPITVFVLTTFMRGGPKT